MEYHRHSQLSLFPFQPDFPSLFDARPLSFSLSLSLSEHARRHRTRRCPLITDISRRLIVGFRSKRNRQRGRWIERRKIASLYRTEGDTHPLRARQNSPSDWFQSRRPTRATEDHAVKTIVDPADVTRRFFPRLFVIPLLRALSTNSGRLLLAHRLLLESKISILALIVPRISRKRSCVFQEY